MFSIATLNIQFYECFTNYANRYRTKDQGEKIDSTTLYITLSSCNFVIYSHYSNRQLLSIFKKWMGFFFYNSMHKHAGKQI